MDFFNKIIYNEDYLSFLTTNIPTCFINGMRRTLLSDIKSYAFDKVDIKKNTSILHNEILTHRINLIPLSISNHIKIKLEVTNKTEEMINVTSNDIEILEGGNSIIPDILLVKLNPLESIHLEATTNFDSGRVNAKYQPVSLISFKILELVKINNIKKWKKLNKNNKKALFELCNKKMNMLKPYIRTENDIFGYFEECDRSYLLIEEINKYAKLIFFNEDVKDLFSIETFKYNKNNVYKFELETMGQDSKSLLLKSIRKIREKLLELKNKNINLQEHNVMKNCTTFILHDEKHMIGNILEYSLLNISNVELATYVLKHPLDPFITLTFKLKNRNNNDFSDYTDVYIECINNSIDFCNKMEESYLNL